MIAEWVWVAWHLKGAPELSEYRRYSKFDRAAIRAELNRLIEESDADLEGPGREDDD